MQAAAHLLSRPRRQELPTARRFLRCGMDSRRDTVRPQFRRSYVPSDRRFFFPRILTSVRWVAFFSSLLFFQIAFLSLVVSGPFRVTNLWDYFPEKNILQKLLAPLGR